MTSLKARVQGVGPGASLSDKVTQVQSYLAANDVTDARGTLKAFINEVQASLTKTAAAPLVASATQIRAVLGC